MEDNIYMLPDIEIQRRIGQKIRWLRLRRNFTQTSLAGQAGISVSTLKKIERGEINSFDSLMRILRMLGQLEVFMPLIEEDEMSPNEYYEFIKASKKRQRRRASSMKSDNQSTIEEEPQW